MRGVILDAASVGDTPLSPILDLGDKWEVFDHSDENQIPDRIKEADIVITNKTVISAEAISSATNLKLIALFATGSNNIAVEAAKARNIVVSNARAYATPSVAQHTLGLMLNLATNIPAYTQDVAAGEWQRSQTFAMLQRPIMELSGKTLGIVGYGELGRAVADLARAFGMEVLIYQRQGSEKVENHRLPLEALAERSDVLSLHCPLTPDNRHMINQAIFSRMKPSAFLINTARGALVNSEDLITALKTKQIAAAALDTLEIEPPPLDEPLIQAKLDNLFITPHSAWAAFESRGRLIHAVADNIRAFLAGKPQNQVT